jgi:hypothetical protein
VIGGALMSLIGIDPGASDIKDDGVRERLALG